MSLTPYLKYLKKIFDVPKPYLLFLKNSGIALPKHFLGDGHSCPSSMGSYAPGDGQTYPSPWAET